MTFQRTAIVAFALAAAASAVPASADAAPDIRVGPHGGFSFDAERAFIGVDAWFGIADITDNISLHLSPVFSYYFMPDNTTLWQLEFNVPFLFAIPNFDVLQPYAAAGLALRHFSFNVDSAFIDVDVSDTDLGLNLIGGAMFIPEGSVNPFVQLRVNIGGESDAAIMGGVRFNF